MIRILVINDVHLAPSPPSGCRDIYVADIKNMLTEARSYAIDMNIDYTVFTGDFFHAKRAGPGTPGIIRWAMELLQGWPGRRLAIVGNHDLTYEGLDSVPDQPIGCLFEDEALEWMRRDFVTTDGDITIQWSPANYHDAIDHNPANFGLERVAGVDWAIKVAHGTLTPPGKGYPYHTVPMDTVPTEGMDLCLYGHPHYDVGVIEHGGCTFACLGSMGRTQNNEDERAREMRLLLVEVTKKTLDFQELPLTSASPADALFYERVVDTADDGRAMHKLMKSIDSAALIEQGSIPEVVAALGDVDPRAAKRLGTYLEKAGL